MIWAICIGFIIGLVAKLITPGKDPGGCIATTLLGIAGSLVAALIGQGLGWYRPNQPAGFIASVIGAIVLLLIFRFIRGPRPRHGPGGRQWP